MATTNSADWEPTPPTTLQEDPSPATLARPELHPHGGQAMHDPRMMLLFLLVVLLVLGGMQAYVWHRVVSPLVASWPGQLWLRVAWWLPALALVGAFATQRLSPGELQRTYLLVAFSWLGVLFFLLVATLAAEPIRGLLTWWSSHGGADADRRQFLSRAVATGVLVAGSTLSTTALAMGQSRIRVRELEVEIANLPEEFDGFRVAHLTDLHIGPTLREAFVAEVLSLTNSLHADLIAVTGDLVDGPVEGMGPLVAPLAKLEAKHGVAYCTGNHEYYSGADEWCAHMDRLGWRVLRNDGFAVERGAARLFVAGSEDEQAGRFGRPIDVDATLAQRRGNEATLLLAHQPRTASRFSGKGVGLMLAGHTHGGQIWPWNHLVPLQQPLVRGFGMVEDVPVSIGNGTGYWGPPMRLGAPSEIVLVTLRRRATN